MRLAIVLLTTATLMACNRPSGDPAADAGEAAGAATAIAASYDGSEAEGEAARLAHGERLGRVLGCRNCHGEDYRGGNVTEIAPELGDIHAPNLTLALSGYSDAELEAAVRNGKPRDGRAMIFMPSEMYRMLGDADYAALVAHLRTLEPGGEATPPVAPSEALFAAAADWGIVPGEDGRPYYADMRAADLGAAHEKGRYIAETACTECHKADLTGLPGFSPDLGIAAAYSRDEFAAMLRSGVGKAKPDLGYMSWAAKARFAHFTDAEIAALHAYLTVRAEAQPPQ